MGVPFVLSQEIVDSNPHSFRIYRVIDENNSDWLKHLAQEYIKLLTQWETGVANIIENMGDIAMDTSLLERYLKEANIPDYKGDKFDVIRSDFGELLCYLFLEEEHKTLFGPKSITYRELKDQTGRGIDAIGIEKSDPLTLVLCEVKVSNESASPPNVVDAGNKSLKQQHLYHLQNISRDTSSKILRAARLSKDSEISALLSKAGLYLRMQKLDKISIIICNVLVRPTTKYKLTDFGSFRSGPTQYSPATIRFLIPCVPEEIDLIIEKWYNIIQEGY